MCLLCVFEGRGLTSTPLVAGVLQHVDVCWQLESRADVSIDACRSCDVLAVTLDAGVLHKRCSLSGCSYMAQGMCLQAVIFEADHNDAS